MSTDLSPTPAVQRDEPVPTVAQAAGRAVQLSLGVLLIAGGVVLALYFAGDAMVQIDESQTSHLDVDRVVFDLGANGSVEVVTHDGPEVLVHERIETTVREVRTSQSVVDGELRIDSDDCSGWFGLLVNRCGASYVLAVPAATLVSGDVAHGGVRLADLQGGIDLRVGHGSVEATGTTGPASLATGHGSITVRDADGVIDADTGHGSVSVERVTGDVAATTDHGGVTITQVHGTVEANTGHGSITVREVAGDLDARTRHGSIDVTATSGGQAWLDTGHGHIGYHPGAAPSSVVVRTSHGNVEVTVPRDAPAYALTTNAGDRSANVEVATDPGSTHQMDVATGHGRIHIGYAG